MPLSLGFIAQTALEIASKEEKKSAAPCIYSFRMPPLIRRKLPLNGATNRSSKREPDLRGDPGRHFAIDNWRWGIELRFLWRILVAFRAQCLPSAVLESVFSKCTRATRNALGFTKWERVLFQSFYVLFHRFLTQLCLSAPTKIYWTTVEITISCWRIKKIRKVGYLVLVYWIGKIEMRVKIFGWCWRPRRLWSWCFFYLSYASSWDPEQILFTACCISPTTSPAFHQFRSRHNFLHHRKDVKSESEWQFPRSTDAWKKGHTIKSPDIKSPRREFTADGSRPQLITAVSCLLHQELIQSF